MPQLDAGAEVPSHGGGQGRSPSDALRSAVPRIVETWIEKVMNRSAAEGEEDGEEDDRWIAGYRAFGASVLHQVAVQLRDRREGLRETADTVIGRMVTVGRRSGAPTWRVVDNLMLLVPVTLGELRGEGRSGLSGDMVSDRVTSAVMAVARGMDSMAARMERERSETLDARTEMLIHELHNRFGAADTASRLLTRRSRPSDSAWLQRIASLIQSAVDEGLRTVENMRPLTSDPWPVSLPVLARDVLREHEGTAADQGIDLRACGTLPDVLVDGSKLRMILSNLVDNALTYHDEAKARRRVIVTASRPEPRRVVVSIKDNGVGIGKGRLQRVFLPGIRSGDRRGAGGEGLGLAVVREAIDRMSGMVEVASERGMGTTFRITFAPMTREDELS